jgi:hypothetical protein
MLRFEAYLCMARLKLLLLCRLAKFAARRADFARG